MPGGTFRTGPPQGGGFGDGSLSAPLHVGLFDRGRRIVRDNVRLRKRSAAQCAHRLVLPFDRLGNA
ncbi:hypothetical protein ACIPW5_25685 [Streptomyces sp. NPDC090077]|uniref:hypothetical protein n=1 Tax=Streptomyces sp. NPDC090077 TaxID=3365938 RepID=UPI003800C76B